MGRQFTSTCAFMKRSARSATVGSGAGSAGTGSSPRRMRSIIAAARRRRRLGLHVPVTADHGPPRSRRPARLRDVDLPPAAVHSDPEPRQVAVPEHGVAASRGQRLHAAHGEPDGGSGRHVPRSPPCLPVRWPNPAARIANPGFRDSESCAGSALGCGSGSQPSGSGRVAIKVYSWRGLQDESAWGESEYPVNINPLRDTCLPMASMHRMPRYRSTIRDLRRVQAPAPPGAGRKA